MPASLSPRQLKELATGDKVFVFYGQDPSMRQRLFPTAVPRKVINYFSTYCSQKLEVEKKTVLCFGTGGSKDVLKFAFQWMCAGGWDTQRQMSNMGATALVDLYCLAMTLDVKALQRESQRLLTGSVVHKLSLSEVLLFYKKARDFEIDFAQQKAEARLCYLLRGTPLDPRQMKFVYENTSEDSTVRATAIKKLAAAVKWAGHDSAPYEDYCGENPKFNDDMIEASAGHLESGCFKVHPELAPPEKVCENCHKFGHQKENCFKLFPEKAPRRAATLNDRHQAQQGHNPMGQRAYQGAPARTSTGTTASLADYIKPKKN
ncbi:MAG: hypothetical protein M1812_002688 [Candelaria pacifica]|nr:MAG: hypothetical protein M1812_002688 [Candelaria pacifica]